MKYVIDNSNLYAGGGIQVGISFINDLSKLNLSNEYHIIQSFKMAEAFKKIDYPSNFIFYDLNVECEQSILVRAKQVKLLEDKIKPDCIFTLFGPSYHKSNFPKIVGFAIPHIIYPESPFIKNLSLSKKIKNLLICKMKQYFFIKNADALVFETKDASKKFEKLSGFKNNYVVSNTLNEVFLDESKWENFIFSDNNKLKILVVTANYPHKNLQVIPNIIRKLINDKKIENFEFVITLDKNELNFPDFCENYIQYIGKVSLNKLPSLYKQSTMVFIPTLLEVFSATYLEAMYMQKAIVASDMGFSRDICGDAAFYCDPTNIDDYANTISLLLRDIKLRLDLEQKGVSQVLKFGSSMGRTKMYLDILGQVLEGFKK
ncbi:glycosyltransferase [Acinetobacter johnsonii]|uniref:glycosyltransferase n=1 Tax=Acinetobacter johnsonii TaxID=40214 RepID=UPI0011E62AC0|nr:glycosyltransferase [Acinetobacter johnsonii]QEK37239.1 glycosyltransferase [Acinetobacter johnsonii]